MIYSLWNSCWLLCILQNIYSSPWASLTGPAHLGPTPSPPAPVPSLTCPSPWRGRGRGGLRLAPPRLCLRVVKGDCPCYPSVPAIPISPRSRALTVRVFWSFGRRRHCCLRELPRASPIVPQPPGAAGWSAGLFRARNRALVDYITPGRTFPHSVPPLVAGRFRRRLASSEQTATTVEFAVSSCAFPISSPSLPCPVPRCAIVAVRARRRSVAVPSLPCFPAVCPVTTRLRASPGCVWSKPRSFWCPQPSVRSPAAVTRARRRGTVSGGRAPVARSAVSA